MFNFRRIPINRVVEKIAELGTPSLVLLVAMGRIEPFFQSRLLNRFAALAGLYCHRKFRPPSKPRLRFTPEFKAEVVLEALSGESSQAELCRKPYNLREDQLSKWAVYHTSVSPKTPAFGVRVFDTCRISAKKLVL